MNEFISQSTTYQLILFTTLGFALMVQLFFYLIVYLRVSFVKFKKVGQANLTPPPVSVVICARNEESNLENFLPLILQQDYPNFEVIVVNDCSYDNSDMVLKRLMELHSNLRVTTIKPDEKFTHGKKLALTIGIKAAKHEWLLLTDADCKPEGKHWISSMAKQFNGSTEVVIGYGGYIRQRGILNMLIRFDAFFIAMQYLGFAKMGLPYMGVGRNLAYRKDLFFKNKGFAAHSILSSGDDDLFIHQVANKKNSSVEYCHSSHTRSVARTSFKDWQNQKKRHLTTAPFYRGGVKLLLGLEPLSRILFWGSIILLLVEQTHTPVVLGVLTFRLLLSMVILKLAMNRLNERKILLISLLYDLISPLLIGSFMLSNLLTIKRSKWN